MQRWEKPSQSPLPSTNDTLDLGSIGGPEHGEATTESDGTKRQQAELRGNKRLT